MPSESIVYIAIELSVSSWVVAARLPGIDKSRVHRLEGGDTAALLKTISDLRMQASAKLGGYRRGSVLFRGGSRWLLAAPLADGSRHRRLCARADQHPGEPPRSPG